MNCAMLSFASAAYRSDKTLLRTYTANLELLDGAQGHPETMFASCNPQPN